jgi:dipeptidyl-peptidase 4
MAHNNLIAMFRRCLMKRYGFALLLTLVFLPTCPAAEATGEITFERLFQRPYLWGTSPSKTRWAEDSNKRFAFLWNAEGGRFREIYIGTTRTGKHFRLTHMDQVEPSPYEGDKRTDEEKEKARKKSRGISDYVWRPDGKQIAFEYLGDIWLIEPKKGAKPKRLFKTRTGESKLDYSPDADILSFYSDRNIWFYHLKDGVLEQRTTLSSPKWVTGYNWFRDGKRLLVFYSDSSRIKEVSIPDYVPKTVKINKSRRISAGEKSGVHRFGVCDATGGLVHWFKPKKDQSRMYDVEPSPNGKYLAYHEVSEDFKKRSVFLIDTDNMKAEEIYSETTETWISSREGDRTLQWTQDSSNLIFMSGKSGWQQIYKLAVDTTGEVPIRITPDGFDVDQYRVNRDGKTLYFLAYHPRPVEMNVFKMDIDGGEPVRMSNLDGSSVASYSPDGRYCMLRNSSVTRSSESYLVDSKKPQAPRKITESTLPGFENIPLVEPKYVQFSSHDGRTIWGRLMLPPNREPGKKYPAVIANMYANSAKNRWGWALNHWMAARMDYVIMHIDFRASDGYGEDFLKGYYHSMGIVDASECVDAANYLKSLDYVDGDNIGLWGHSYGGFLTHMTLFQHPGVFKAGIAVAPVNDWKNYNYYYTGQRLDTPKSASEVYKKTSPINLADGLQDNLLMIHGMQDDNVLFQDTVQLVQKLIEKNKQFEVMFYPKDDHGISREDSIVHRMNLMVAYFERQLRAGE